MAGYIKRMRTRYYYQVSNTVMPVTDDQEPGDPTIYPSPETYEEAYGIVEDALEQAHTSLPIETDIQLALRWTYDPFVRNAMDGVAGTASSPDKIDLRFTAEAEQWQDALETGSFHEYAHIYVFEQRGRHAENRWERIADEALTQRFADRHTDYEPPWRDAYDEETVADYWDELREGELDRSLEDIAVDGNDPLFINDTEDGYPNWLGYSLANQIGAYLEQEHELSAFPRLEKDDIIAAGDQLYGDTTDEE